MEVEKRSSKGGFLQLFDWNGKSRKKLFSNKSDVSEGAKQGKENLDSLDMPQPQQLKLHESVPGPSLRGCDYASSVNSDEGYGVKAPGVVARLMGLDSLPTSDVSEPCFTPVFGTHSFRDSHHSRRTSDFQHEYHDIDYGMRNKLDGFSRNPVEARLQKLQNRPIERFQTEMLPPKSAKSVPITHHRLLSPIKSPGFILTRNAAYIMETAAKMIEQSPLSTVKGKMPSVVSNSVPLRIRDLRERMEAAQKVSNSRLPDTSQRPKENSSMKYMKAQPRDVGQNRSELLVSKQGGSGSVKNKDKPVSLAVQARVNVQKKDGAASRGNRSLMNQKEDADGKPGGPFDKKQRSAPRSVQQNRMSTGKTCPDVLRQNNQKQNCGPNKGGRTSLKPRVPYQQDRKAVSTNGSFKESYNSNKVVENSTIGNKKISSVATEAGKDLSSSITKKFSGKKRTVNGDIDFNGSCSNSASVKEKERSVKCNITIDGCTKWEPADRKSGMDVVSFTFTSPIKKPLPGSQQAVVTSRSLCFDPCDDQTDSKFSTLPALGLNVIGGDALSVLLEQKLQELTSRVESSHRNMDNGASTSSSSSSLPDLVQSSNYINTVSTEHEKKAVEKWQRMEDIEQNSQNKNSDFEKELDSQDPSAVSSLEPSFSDGSCITSDSKTSFTSVGNKQYLSAEALEAVHDIYSKRSEFLEGEMELSDSASSVSVGVMGRADITSSSRWCVPITRSSHWELEYVKYILSNADLMFEEFVLGEAPNIIPPNLFDQLESQRTVLSSDKTFEEYFKLDRKVWFECVRECLETKCQRHLSGSGKAWSKWTTLSRRKDLLAEELHKAILGWSSMGDSMVDELVDKDMSSQHGKWVDFEAEAFEEGAAVGNGILTSLIDELVADLFC